MKIIIIFLIIFTYFCSRCFRENSHTNVSTVYEFATEQNSQKLAKNKNLAYKMAFTEHRWMPG